MSKARRIAELLSDRANSQGQRLTPKDFRDVEAQIKNPCGEVVLGPAKPCCLSGPVVPVPVSPHVACERTLYNGPSNC